MIDSCGTVHHVFILHPEYYLHTMDTVLNLYVSMRWGHVASLATIVYESVCTAVCPSAHSGTRVLYGELPLHEETRDVFPGSVLSKNVRSRVLLR